MITAALQGQRGLNKEEEEEEDQGGRLVPPAPHQPDQGGGRLVKTTTTKHALSKSRLPTGARAPLAHVSRIAALPDHWERLHFWKINSQTLANISTGGTR